MYLRFELCIYIRYPIEMDLIQLSLTVSIKCMQEKASIRLLCKRISYS